MYSEFLKRYHLLKPGSKPSAPDAKVATKELIDFLVSKESEKVKADLVRFGLTKIFFRAGQLAAIEELRERAISRMIVAVQAGSRYGKEDLFFLLKILTSFTVVKKRAFLARRLYDKMREQTVAVKILQRNIRAWLELQNWGWWNLYVKARPMITTRNFAKEIEELQAEVKELKRALAEAQADRDKVSKERSDAESEIELLAAKLKQLEANLSDLLGTFFILFYFRLIIIIFIFVFYFYFYFYFFYLELFFFF